MRWCSTSITVRRSSTSPAQSRFPQDRAVSLRPLLTGDTPNDWRPAFFYEYFKEPKYTSPTVLAVRTNTSKLIKYPGHDEWTEVFDLKNDPLRAQRIS